MHISLGGEWDYDLDLKTTPSAPIRVGWLRAILLGHQRVAAGLHIDVPILVLASSTSETWPGAGTRASGPSTRSSTSSKIAGGRPSSAACVTIVRIDEAVHDVILSAPNVRKIAMDEISPVD